MGGRAGQSGGDGGVAAAAFRPNAAAAVAAAVAAADDDNASLSSGATVTQELDKEAAAASPRRGAEEREGEREARRQSRQPSDPDAVLQLVRADPARYKSALLTMLGQLHYRGWAHCAGAGGEVLVYVKPGHDDSEKVGLDAKGKPRKLTLDQAMLHCKDNLVGVCKDVLSKALAKRKVDRDDSVVTESDVARAMSDDLVRRRTSSRGSSAGDDSAASEASGRVPCGWSELNDEDIPVEYAVAYQFLFRPLLEEIAPGEPKPSDRGWRCLRGRGLVDWFYLSRNSELKGSKATGRPGFDFCTDKAGIISVVRQHHLAAYRAFYRETVPAGPPGGGVAIAAPASASAAKPKPKRLLKNENENGDQVQSTVDNDEEKQREEEEEEARPKGKTAGRSRGSGVSADVKRKRKRADDREAGEHEHKHDEDEDEDSEKDGEARPKSKAAGGRAKASSAARKPAAKGLEGARVSDASVFEPESDAEDEEWGPSPKAKLSRKSGKAEAEEVIFDAVAEDDSEMGWAEEEEEHSPRPKKRRAAGARLKDAKSKNAKRRSSEEEGMYASGTSSGADDELEQLPQPKSAKRPKANTSPKPNARTMPVLALDDVMANDGENEQEAYEEAAAEEMEEDEDEWSAKGRARVDAGKPKPKPGKMDKGRLPGKASKERLPGKASSGKQPGKASSGKAAKPAMAKADEAAKPAEPAESAEPGETDEPEAGKSETPGEPAKKTKAQAKASAGKTALLEKTVPALPEPVPGLLRGRTMVALPGVAAEVSALAYGCGAFMVNYSDLLDAEALDSYLELTVLGTGTEEEGMAHALQLLLLARGWRMLHPRFVLDSCARRQEQPWRRYEVPTGHDMAGQAWFLPVPQYGPQDATGQPPRAFDDTVEGALSGKVVCIAKGTREAALVKELVVLAGAEVADDLAALRPDSVHLVLGSPDLPEETFIDARTEATVNALFYTTDFAVECVRRGACLASGDAAQQPALRLRAAEVAEERQAANAADAALVQRGVIVLPASGRRVGPGALVEVERADLPGAFRAARLVGLQPDGRLLVQVLKLAPGRTWPTLSDLDEHAIVKLGQIKRVLPVLPADRDDAHLTPSTTDLPDVSVSTDLFFLSSRA